MLLKTPADNLNHSILLFRSHLIVAWQTQPPAENICSHIYSRTSDICIRTSSLTEPIEKV